MARRWQVVIAVAVAAASVTLVAIAAPRRGFFDLKVYYGAINFWAHGRGEVYDYLAPLTKYGFTYPPFAGLSMLPMAVLPWKLVIIISLAVVAMVTTSLATLVAAAVAPHASRIFWTDALWDTDRIGQLSYISNQSVEGFVARLHPGSPSTKLWAGIVLVLVVVWVWRVRRAVRLGDERAGLALTGVLACLISPVTWIHHLVWLVPATLLLVARGLDALGTPRHRRGVRLLVFAGVLDALLSSRLVWYYSDHFTGWGLLVSNLYVLASVALLLGLPLVRVAAGSADPADVPDLGQLDERAVDAAHRKGRSTVVEAEAEVRVETARRVVGLEYP